MLGERIRTLRREHDFSQDELGVKLGVSGDCVDRWENGHGEPSLEQLVAVSKLFGVSVDSLVDGYEAPANSDPPAPASAAPSQPPRNRW